MLSTLRGSKRHWGPVITQPLPLGTARRGAALLSGSKQQLALRRALRDKELRGGEKPAALRGFATPRAEPLEPLPLPSLQLLFKPQLTWKEGKQTAARPGAAKRSELCSEFSAVEGTTACPADKPTHPDPSRRLHGQSRFPPWKGREEEAICPLVECLAASAQREVGSTTRPRAEGSGGASASPTSAASDYRTAKPNYYRAFPP